MDPLRQMISEIEAEVRYTRDYIGKDRLDARVLEAMAQVPREDFVPERMKPYAYDNNPLPIGRGQTISQPYIVALMTDLIRADEDAVILEVGAGSGYQSAILSRLVRQVYATEIVRELADAAQLRLQRLGYHNVAVRDCDGYFGWPEHAPYDGIMVAAAAPAVPPPLIEQLKPGGRLVIPVGEPYFSQELQVVEKDARGESQMRRVLGVSFVPLTGDHHGQSGELNTANNRPHGEDRS